MDIFERYRDGYNETWKGEVFIVGHPNIDLINFLPDIVYVDNLYLTKAYLHYTSYILSWKDTIVQSLQYIKSLNSIQHYTVSLYKYV